jgi:hypothetical protein
MSLAKAPSWLWLRYGVAPYLLKYLPCVGTSLRTSQLTHSSACPHLSWAHFCASRQLYVNDSVRQIELGAATAADDVSALNLISQV